MKKEKLFSITKKDFDIQTFASGGPGGQHQNKTASGVSHRDSGAVGESKTIEQKVEEQMKPENLKLEIKDEKGRWSEKEAGWTGFIGD